MMSFEEVKERAAIKTFRDRAHKDQLFLDARRALDQRFLIKNARIQDPGRREANKLWYERESERQYVDYWLLKEVLRLHVRGLSERRIGRETIVNPATAGCWIRGVKPASLDPSRYRLNYSRTGEVVSTDSPEFHYLAGVFANGSVAEQRVIFSPGEAPLDTVREKIRAVVGREPRLTEGSVEIKSPDLAVALLEQTANETKVPDKAFTDEKNALEYARGLFHAKAITKVRISKGQQHPCVTLKCKDRNLAEQILVLLHQRFGISGSLNKGGTPYITIAHYDDLQPITAYRLLPAPHHEKLVGINRPVRAADRSIPVEKYEQYLQMREEGRGPAEISRTIDVNHHTVETWNRQMAPLAVNYARIVSLARKYNIPFDVRHPLSYERAKELGKIREEKTESK